MSKHDNVHARILVVEVTADESDDDLTIFTDGVTFYRSRMSLTNADGFAVPFSGGTGSATMEIEFSTVLPPINVLRITSTFQA